MQYILYLHGFHSSPLSEKTAIFKRYLDQACPDITLIAPQIPVHIQPSIELIDELVEQYPFSGVIGSSLGGYLATYLHNKYDLPIVLINPAVKPFEVLHEYLGEQIHPITGQEYELTDSDMKGLIDLYQDKIKNPNKIWLLQQEKDEILDYRMALEKYQNCKVTFELEGNHSFVGFDRFPAQIVAFFDGFTNN